MDVNRLNALLASEPRGPLSAVCEQLMHELSHADPDHDYGRAEQAEQSLREAQLEIDQLVQALNVLTTRAQSLQMELDHARSETALTEVNGLKNQIRNAEAHAAANLATGKDWEMRCHTAEAELGRVSTRHAETQGKHADLSSRHMALRDEHAAERSAHSATAQERDNWRAHAYAHQTRADKLAEDLRQQIAHRDALVAHIVKNPSGPFEEVLRNHDGSR